MKNHVLIVEDDKSIAEFFRAVLTLAGLVVETEHTVREGLVKLSTSTPDLVLLDLNLGSELGGEDILYQIRSNPRFDATFVIVVTGYPNLAITIGELADMVLFKPIDIEQLTTLSHRLLSQNIAPKLLQYRDPVTSLYILEFFHSRLELAFERGRRRPDFYYGVIALSLEVLDKTDQIVCPDLDTSILLWREIADRIRKNVRPTDTVARSGDWHFLILNEDLHQIDDIKIVVNRLEHILSSLFHARERIFKIKMNCGFATRDDRFFMSDDILEEAERQLAMVRAV